MKRKTMEKHKRAIIDLATQQGESRDSIRRFEYGKEANENYREFVSFRNDQRWLLFFLA
jgi:hypothetical protein